MKLLTTVIGILILLNTSLQAQNDAESKQSSKSFSLSEIFYKVRPVLDKKEKAELKQELTETQSRIDKAINYRTSLKDSIFMETKLDTVKIPVHLRMLGGYINIPKLTPIQKSAKDIQIEIKELDKKIENAFKHGISLKNKSIIKIDLNVIDNELNFKVKNTVNTVKQKWDDQTSGIGLKNVKRRLELLYPDLHHLDIQNENEMFEVHLNLKL